MRTIGENGLALVRYCEGVCDRVYLDSVGIPTAGVGHIIRAADGPLEPGDSVTEAQIGQWLHDDLAMAESAVNRHCPDLATQNAFDALTDFAFNEGEGGLAQLVQNGNATPGGIAEQFSHWTRAGHAHPLGLIKRRALERDLFLAPDGPMPDGWLTKYDVHGP